MTSYDTRRSYYAIGFRRGSNRGLATVVSGIPLQPLSGLSVRHIRAGTRGRGSPDKCGRPPGVAHWATLQTPLAYFWTTLRRAVQRHLGAIAREQQRREAYALQQRFHRTLADGTARAVEDILASVPSRQRQLLLSFCQGYEDAQVAAQLGTTPHAVRQARYETYIALRH